MKKYYPGTIFNEFTGSLSNINKRTGVRVYYPTRLESMVLDPSKININLQHKYDAGQINFKINLMTSVNVFINDIDEIDSNRDDLIIHAVELFRHATKIKDKFKIKISKEIDIKHGGLGSSSNLISCVSFALNALYGFPIKKKDCVQYIAQNHVEESTEKGKVVLVQSLGGSAAAGFLDGSLQIISGYSSLIYKKKLPEEYDVIFGIPNDFKSTKAETLMDKEIDNLEGFVETGKIYSKEISQRLVHECLPEINNDNLEPLGRLIFDYRFKMGSIKNCSFVYPPMIDIAKSLKDLYFKKYCKILSISSVGPGFFTLSTGNENKEVIEKLMRKNNLSTYSFKLFNNFAQFYYEK